MAKFFIVAALLALATHAFAAPADEVTQIARDTFLCANEAGDVCPTGWTCCGPITSAGGICRKLNAGEACAL